MSAGFCIRKCSQCCSCMCDHNLCEMYGDHFQSEWELNERCKDETDVSCTTNGSQTASEIHNALAQYLTSN